MTTAWLLIFTNTWIDFITLGFVVYVFVQRQRRMKGPRGRGVPGQGPANISPPARGETELDRAYRTLDLKPGVSFKEVQSAYRELARIWHPDRFANDAKLSLRANTKLGEINQAYETLRRYLRG
jgi:DnaJ-class molecular chaperone